MSKKLIKFRVHPAVFLNEKGEHTPGEKTYLFLNVRNDGTKPITIEEVQHAGRGKSFAKLRNKERPLPLTLEPGKEWETWTRQTDKNKDHYNLYFYLRYKNSQGRSLGLHATKRYAVPSKGQVPTGK